MCDFDTGIVRNRNRILIVIYDIDIFTSGGMSL